MTNLLATSNAKNFVDEATSRFLLENGFLQVEHIDPHVIRYFGSFLCSEARLLIERKFGHDATALVWINCNDNSDFACSQTFRVEIGVKDDRNAACAGKLHTFGIFGSSSPFCASINAAMIEASIAFLYRFSDAARQNPNIQCWRRRDPYSSN